MIAPKEHISVWERLQMADKPVVLYGMGNGADKILELCNEKKISVAGVFASDGFCRGHSYRQYNVMTYGQAKQRFGEMIVLLAFGTHLPDVMQNIEQIAAQQELYAPDVPVFGGDLFDLSYLQANRDKLDEAFNMLADNQSKKVFLNTLDYKISGKIKYLRDCETDREEAYNEILKLSGGEIYIDAGAYNGDTVIEFARHVNGYRRIIAIEPDGRNMRKLLANTKILANVECVQLALHREKGNLLFASRAGRNSSIDESGFNTLPANSIDNLLDGGAATFIKLDVEGHEMDAILGAQKTIAGCKPKIQAAAYHRSNDLFEIPLQIKKIRPDYKVYMRHFPCFPAWDTNYYFV